MLRIALLTVLFCLTTFSRAEHLSGGSITYECLGGNTYTVTLTLFRDCSGEPMIPQSLRFANDCGVIFTLSDLQPQEVSDVSPLCQSEAGNSACNGGPQPGYQAYIYRQTVFLSPCNAWTISWFVCCRRSSINVTGNPGLYIEARLNNLGGVCNNSPAFSDPGVPAVCSGQQVVYNAGASEPDGHTLSYRFIEARFGTPDPFPVLYNFPFFGLEPFTGMLMDPNTGQITFTPTTQGVIVVAFQVDEYAADGTWIGSVMRDFPFLVLSCSNIVPPPTSGSITEVSGTGSQSGDRSARICSNGTVCLDLVFIDPDGGQSLSISSNLDVVLPEATVTNTGTNPLNVQICWDATDAPPGQRTFVIQANDGACPIPGTQSYTYQVTVEIPPASIGSGAALACPQTGSFALMDSLGTYPQAPGNWTDPAGAPHSGLFVPTTDPSGEYTFTVENFPGCVSTATVAVDLLAPNDTLCSLLSVSDLLRPTLSLHPNPTQGRAIVRGLGTLGTRALSATVLDLLGRRVLSIPLDQASNEAAIDFPDDMPEGTYLLMMTSEAPPATVIRFHLQR
jgi:hypothetical protein